MTVTGGKVELMEIPVPPTSPLSDPTLHDGSARVTIRFEYDLDGARHRAGFRFATVRAYRYRPEGHCTTWHLEGAYETLVEVTDSQWVAELYAVQSDHRWNWHMHHFMVYIEGCYEVVAQSWEWFDEVVEVLQP